MCGAGGCDEFEFDDVAVGGGWSSLVGKEDSVLVVVAGGSKNTGVANCVQMIKNKDEKVIIIYININIFKIQKQKTT